MKKSSKFVEQISSYIFVGILAVLVDFLSYLFFSTQVGLSLSFSKRISYILGAILSYTLNKKITFKSKKRSINEPILFLVIYLLSFVLNFTIHDFVNSYFGSMISFTIATTLTVIFNFMGQKFIVFKK